MSNDELQKMYDEILACYSSFGVNVTGALAEDEPIIEGPASILFKVRPGSGVDPRKVYEKAEALKLKLRLESDQNVGFDNDRGYVTIDIPKSENQRYFVDAEELWGRWTRPEFSLATPLGEDRFGETVEIDFSSSNSPHLLIGGTTGSGKSEALNTILYGLATHYSSAELQLLLVDPKGTELSNFEHSRHLRGTIGIFDDDAIDLLKEAVIEMKSRYERFRAVRVRSIAEYNKQSTTNERLPWWVIVLDEYGDLTSDSQKKKEIEQELKRLAQMARACGIHVIIATQKPSAEVISTNLRSNLPAQLALRVKSGIESRVIMDDMGAETLNGKGDAFVKVEGKLRRVQCARVRNPAPLD
jgi:DNA phosphorothioation-dependent restriction protein DptH